MPRDQANSDESSRSASADQAAQRLSKNQQRTVPVERIVSGGQTGVDRSALDTAIALNIPHGGWCPRGRLAEDGCIPARYHMRETEAPEYAVRTERNVVDSCGTLLLYKGRLQRGTLLTYRLAKKHCRPVLRVRLDAAVNVPQIQHWLVENKIKTLNVAGPRASSAPGIETETRELLTRVLTEALPRKLFD